MTRATRRRRACWRRGSAEGILRAEAREAFYLYEQQFGYGGQRYTRRGFFAAVRLEPFERRVVLPHEKTLSAPKEDRKRLLRATHTQISPVFGLYRDAGGAARAIIDEAAGGAPAVDATTADGVRHRLWVITAAPAVDGLRTLLADKQILIADGHHRYETMLGLAPEMRPLDVAAGAAASDYAMMFLARAEDPGSAGAADAPDGERPARLQLRRPGRAAAAAAFDDRAGRRDDRRGDRGAAGARRRQAGGLRGARAGPAVDDLADAEADPRSVGAGAARRCATSTSPSFTASSWGRCWPSTPRRWRSSRS